MAAGLGFKDFTTGEVLTAADVDGYLMQGIWVFASAAARDAAVTSPQEGNACYLKDTDVIQVYTGSTWAAQSASNPISGNIVDAKGDIIAATAADTVARLAVGANDTVLTADSSTATGLKWAAPVSGGGMTLLQSLSLSGASVTSSTFTPADYVSYYIVLEGIYLSTPNSDFNIRLNADTGNNYYRSRINLNDTTFAGARTSGGSSFGIGSLGALSGAGEKASGSIQINRINDTTEVGFQSWLYSTLSAFDDVRMQITMGTYNNSAAISSITFIGATNNFAAGTAYIYGVK